MGAVTLTLQSSQMQPHLACMLSWALAGMVKITVLVRSAVFQNPKWSLLLRAAADHGQRGPT